MKPDTFILGFVVAVVTFVSVACGGGTEHRLAEHGNAWLGEDYTLHLAGGRTLRFDPGSPRVGQPPRAAFSPHGACLAYTVWNDRHGQDIKIYNIEEGTTVTLGCGFRSIVSLDWFEYRGSPYLLYDTPVTRDDRAHLWIFSVKSLRLVLEKHGWSFAGYMEDGTGLRIDERSERGPDAAPARRKVPFDDVVRFDALWIPESEARRIIAGQLSEFLDAVASNDERLLADFVHPCSGLLISTDAYVDTTEDRVFSADEIRRARSDTSVYTVGYTDGSGDPIEETLSQCLDTWVLGSLAGADEIGYNRVVFSGNTVVNTFAAFPGSIVVEYYYRGKPENPDFTWSSRRFVFEELDGRWWLSGVTNDSWTI